MPAGNMFWRDIPAKAKVREHRNYFEVIDGKKHYVANWSSQDAREAQAWLKRRAAGGTTSTRASTRATKRKSPAQLDRDIAYAIKNDRWDDGPDAWQRGYEFAKEASRHETRAEQREVLRRTLEFASTLSDYDRGFVAGYQDVLGEKRSHAKRSHATRRENGNGNGPRILKVSRPKTFAGQRSITAEVQYPGEEKSRVEFVGPSGRGAGPVVMISRGHQTFVTDPSRFGDFGPDWVKRFFKST